MTTQNTTAIALISTLAAVPALAQTSAEPITEPLSEAETVNITDWNNNDIYASGVSAERYMDEIDVYGQDGEEIGDVEDLLIGTDGQVIAIIAEVGGLWDIGDTHVSIPYDQVQVSDDGDGIIVPITEETLDEYGFFGDANEPDVVAADNAADEAVAGLDDAEVRNAWRATELIGDYARVGEGESRMDYGYVNDLILSDGEVSAVVVQPSAAFGGGYRAYPYQDYGMGWNAGSQYYNMPYTEEQAAEIEEFEYERLNGM